MKRRGNVISPIDTINTLAEMLVGTDFTVEDGELVYVRLAQQWFVYRVNSGLVPDGINVIAPAYGNGVWELLNLGPGGSNAGLGPFNTIATGVAGSGRLIDVTVDQISRLKRGNLAWVESVKDYFRWDPTSVLAQDAFNAGGTPMTLVNPTANGANPGRFLREYMPAQEWVLQRQWVVRPSTGNDENTGADDTVPLASMAELHRRWGIVLGVRPELGPGDYHIFLPEGTTAAQNARAYVSARRSQTSTGSAFAINTTLFVHGNTPTTVGAGVLFAGPFTISAVTPVNHATNQALQVASAGIAVSWTAAVLISTTGSNVAKRCRMTTGANIGGTFWPQEDLGNLLGGNPTAMCDEPAAANVYTAAFASGTGTFTPAVGEQFVVETLNVMSGVIDTDPSVLLIFDSISLNVQEAHGSRVFLDKCQLQLISVTTQIELGYLARAVVNGCRFSAETSSSNRWLQCENIDVTNGCVAGGLQLQCTQQGNVTRGFVHGISGSLRLLSGGHSFAGTSTTRNGGWNIISLGIFSVSNTLAFQIADTCAFAATCELWGNGNAFPPVSLLAGAKLFWPAADIFGGVPPASYFFINVGAGAWISNDMAGGNGNNAPAWDTAASTFTAPRLLSPALIQATVAGGGFNGRFFDPTTGCQLVAAQQG